MFVLIFLFYMTIFTVQAIVLLLKSCVAAFCFYNLGNNSIHVVKVFITLFYSKMRFPKLGNRFDQILLRVRHVFRHVIFQSRPHILNGVQVRRFGWGFKPVYVAFFHECLSSFACVFRIVILPKPVFQVEDRAHLWMVRACYVEFHLYKTRHPLCC